LAVELLLSVLILAIKFENKNKWSLACSRGIRIVDHKNSMAWCRRRKFCWPVAAVSFVILLHLVCSFLNAFDSIFYTILCIYCVHVVCGNWKIFLYAWSLLAWITQFAKQEAF
jgi:hypothetical protein